jgi:hypothetical protein
MKSGQVVIKCDHASRRTTAASRPTVCRTVNSDVLNVGKIHAKNEPCICASCGENPADDIRNCPSKIFSQLTLELRPRRKQHRPSRSTEREYKERAESNSRRERKLGRKPWPFEFLCAQGGSIMGEWRAGGYSRVGGVPGMLISPGFTIVSGSRASDSHAVHIVVVVRSTPNDDGIGHCVSAIRARVVVLGSSFLPVELSCCLLPNINYLHFNTNII